MMQFSEVGIGDYDRIQRYFSAYGENSCQHSFVNMFTLYEKYGTQCCEQDGFLYIFRSHMGEKGVRTYLFPMGEGDRRKAVENILEDAHTHGAKVRFDTVTEEKAKWLLEEFPDIFKVWEVRDYAEYIHLSENLANLPGKKFENKRQDAGRVRRTYGDRMEVVPLTKEHGNEILGFEKNWIEELQESHDAAALGLECREMQKQMQYFDELKISGILIRIDGELQGFVYGAPISDNCYDLLVEKGNYAIKHIYRVLEQDVVRMCAMDYEYVNREEDLGIPGLRKSKLSYRPDILLKKYIAEEL